MTLKCKQLNTSKQSKTNRHRFSITQYKIFARKTNSRSLYFISLDEALLTLIVFIFFFLLFNLSLL